MRFGGSLEHRSLSEKNCLPISSGLTYGYSRRYKSQGSSRKQSNKIISEYVKRKSDYLFIHYARQNCFSDAYEKGPRVVAIVAMNANSEQFAVFSLKKVQINKAKVFLS